MSTAILHRMLIKTHHMTSRKKIGVITRAAKTHDCSVLLKVGAPPGIMLCEGEENGVKEWENVVRKLRYKDMRLVKRESIEKMSLGPLGVETGDVQEIEEIKDFAKLLEGDEGLYQWWRVGMGNSQNSHSQPGHGRRQHRRGIDAYPQASQILKRSINQG
ncbi:hypothetical protein GLAREA_10969 [Glarea lozoyensis ATCC 20868]|uniref:Uncharacterized protein n=1 Tax=Glarea lozoyensis (strain ATCC 20868 / MF5171) TaxID=1116229 RepID=S3DA08_GLAL2|nr:uncharacterized protein GLAREA_10969 [Glarea lozoyensis ATCC 20868]EPE35272.1 hypothetical protein GLAREA_10969 [Glarea lozoyensis ATCC 20868]